MTVEKAIGILRYFHLVGLAEAKENPYVWLDRSRRCSIWYVSVRFCGFLVFLSFFFFSNFGNPHSHLWCTKTLFTSFCRTDDVDRINNAIQQRETMGNITARGFITRLHSATVPTDSFKEKKYINRAKLTAQCVYTFYR